MDSDQLFASVAADVHTAMDRVGGMMESAIKDDLDTPVEYITGPRGGKIIVRSKRGEHPRKQSGFLQESVSHETITTGLVTTMSVSDAAPYAGHLDPTLERPIVSGIDDRFGEVMETAVADAVSGKS